MPSSSLPPLSRSRNGNQSTTTAEPVSPGVTVRKAPFPIALVLRESCLQASQTILSQCTGTNILIVDSRRFPNIVLTAVTLTILSVYVPDLIHVTELTPGPTHFETK